MASNFLLLKQYVCIFAGFTNFIRILSLPCLNGSAIPVVEETKFLGIIFDRKLSFLPHIQHLKDKCCTKALNLLRVVAHTTWGADQQTLIRLYRSLIRSKLDYGCVVYGSARGCYLCMLDPIQNHALRLCLNAYRTSPSSSLSVLASEPPLYTRRKRLSMQYLSLIHIWRCRRSYACRSRWSPYH